MRMEHKMIDGTELVSYLRHRQSNLMLEHEVRTELERMIIYIVGTLMQEGKDGES